MVKLLTIILVSLALVSCISPVSSSWSCKNSLNGDCRTIAEIDNNKNKNNYRKHKTNNTSKNDFKTSQSAIQSNLIKKSTYEDIRTAESVSKAVFAPYIDKAGNRHDFSTVYYVERKSDWRN